MTGKIVGTGSYVPEQAWDNNKLTEFMDTNDEWIRERTGIVRRHISEDVATSQMAIEAAKRAIENGSQAGFGPEQVDAIFVCSVTPDLSVPCIACEVQKAIGAEKAFCYDLNAACSGFVFAYNMAVSYMNMGLIKTALIIGSERLSGIIDWSDRGTGILFGDGAGAVLVTASEGPSGMVMHSEGKSGEALMCQVGGKLSMDGQKVFRFAIKRVPEVVTELLDQMNITKDDIDLFLLHQANMRIIESVVKKLGLDMNKVPSNIQEMGNTSSASLPILIDELNRKGALKPGSRMLMAGFGAGLSWGAGYITV
ncbi:MAG: ketoacyl-ACP synthase III [Lachnospiraceae bacterium]|nr:ketoacyl-ACP synthase III [Lachnospiraceae bacterium]MBQ7777108.1 ketoacyl-ACP synthase III [Lachnospiraceae bacterium]